MSDTTKVKTAGDILKPRIEELAEDLFECPKHGTYRGKPFRVIWQFESERIKHTPECPTCAKERMYREAMEADRCKRQEEINRLKAMNIGEKFWDSTFENFDAYNDELKRYLEAAIKFAKNPKGNLVMIGKNGNGKNHLAAAIMKKTGGVMYTCAEIGIKLRDCYNGINSEAAFFDHLCGVRLLVIDEAEKAKESEAKNNWMSYIIGKRYDKRLPTIFIANGHFQDDCESPKKPCPKCLEYHLGNDVISRIFENGIAMYFTSEDYRYRKRMKSLGGHDE
jgi:DNA replication protein DnaC